MGRLVESTLRPQNRHVFQAQVLVRTKTCFLMMTTTTRTLFDLWSMIVIWKMMKLGQIAQIVVKELIGDEKSYKKEKNNEIMHYLYVFSSLYIRKTRRLVTTEFRRGSSSSWFIVIYTLCMYCMYPI